MNDEQKSLAELEHRHLIAIARREEAEKRFVEARAQVELIGRARRATAIRELSAESGAERELADAREEEEVAKMLLAHQRDLDGTAS